MATPAEETFAKLYAKLNEKQREAVDAIDGPVMVVAGPGTGKTQILTLRIAKILQATDTPPEGILALTFTDAGVRAMRERLVSIIGAPAYRVRISTFHGFAHEVITRHPEAFPRIIGSRQILPYERLRILERVVAEGDFSLIRPIGDPLFYVKALSSAISDLKREGISPDEYVLSIKARLRDIENAPDLLHEKGRYKGKKKAEYADLEKRIDRARECADAYARYEALLREEKLFDFDDSILEVIRAFETTEELLRQFQEKYLYILADEHQDSNGSQNKLLELLANFFEEPNLFVVGDEKQAIFRFQGASLAHFTGFLKRYPTAREIRLLDNYRSTQQILDVAHGILPTNLTAFRGNSGVPIEVRSFPDREAEHQYLVREAEQCLRDGGTSFAILYRANKDAYPIMEALDRAGVPFVVQSAQEILGDPDVQRLITLFSAVVKFPEDDALVRALHLDFFNFDELVLYQAVSEARKARKPLAEVLATDPRVESITRWHKASWQDSAPALASEIMRDSGFLGKILAKKDGVRVFAKIEALWSEIKECAESRPGFTLRDFMEYLDTLAVHGLSLEREITLPGNTIRLMTAHKSKGLEFDRVYIAHTTEKGWEGSARRGAFDLTMKADHEALHDDARKLLYVAVTRAKDKAVLTYSRVSGTGKPELPAALVSELDPRVSVTIDEPDSAPDAERLVRSLAESKPAVPPLGSPEFVARLFDEQGLSPTALNNYLDCPWRYFYRNLLRVPEAQALPAIFGTAVHASLEAIFNTFKETGELSVDALLRRFEIELDKRNLADVDRKALWRKGSDFLKGYITTFRSEFIRDCITEFSVPGVLVGDVRLTGKLDKIERFSDGAVRVIDYKTGTARSGQADKNRLQILFYKLLLDGWENGMYPMREGRIDYLAPDDKGKYKQEVIVPDETSLAELRSEIARVAHEIRTVAFWNSRCGDDACEYCAMRETMRIA